MQSFFKKLPIFFVAIICIALPLQAQQTNFEDSEEPFIEEGIFLTGFSISFINASRDDFNQEYEREFTHLSLQLDGLYFVNDRIGVGPLLGYRFTYRDLEDPFRSEDSDTRNTALEYGVKGGWFIPTAKLFGGTGDSHFFLDGGVSWLRTKFEREPNNDSEPRTQFGFQIGTGFLLPVGKRIALETKLGFQSRRREYRLGRRNPGGEITFTTETRWLKEVALSVGLKVGF
ncbi:MAG: outer membrane beta-barrel protein [Balneolaceae bacterium]|nr:outer membrane beta-barrel protein [Balneolaceae bacterium]